MKAPKKVGPPKKRTRDAAVRDLKNKPAPETVEAKMPDETGPKAPTPQELREASRRGVLN